MAGMVTGDTREFVVIIPETWETESLRGVPARCTVTVNEVFEWELPEVRIACAANGPTHISRTKMPSYNLLKRGSFHDTMFCSEEWLSSSSYSSLPETDERNSVSCRLEGAGSGLSPDWVCLALLSMMCHHTWLTLPHPIQCPVFHSLLEASKHLFGR